MSAEKQSDEAEKIYNVATEEIKGDIDFRHTHVDFSQLHINAEFIDGVNSKTTCPAAIGWSIVGAPPDGDTGLGWLTQKYPVKDADKKCNGVKDIFLPCGSMWPYPWMPQTLPLQILKLGQLAIIAVPGEFTTMSGRRLKKAVMKVLQPAGVNHSVIQGLSNAYASYVTTQEEYQKQMYEGASTPFGEYTLNGFVQEFSRIAGDLVRGNATGDGPEPEDLSNAQHSLIIDNIVDTAPFFKKFGDVHTQPGGSYRRGNKVVVKFWGASLSNNFENIDNYLLVQRKEGNNWVNVSYDWDDDNIMSLDTNLITNSIITIEWTPRADVPNGTYKIQHFGYSKSLFGSFTRYAGESNTFSITN